MPVQQIKHNNDGKFYHIAIDIAKEGAQLFDLTPYVKGRVGDNNFGLLIDWYRQGMLMNVNGAYKPIIDGLVGNFSFDKNGNLKMDDDASPVYSVGKPEDCGPAGQVTYYFPEQMFPKEGIFKGYLGLIDDKGNRYSGVDIWFSVLAGNARMGIACDYYISELEKAIKEAEDDLTNHKKSMQQVVDEFVSKMNDLTSRITTQANDDKALLETLEARIKQDDIVTKPVLDAFEETINQKIADIQKGFNDLKNSSIRIYNTIDDMKADESLAVGQTARTLGKAKLNDGGGQTYKITDDEINRYSADYDQPAVINLNNGHKAQQLDFTNDDYYSPDDPQWYPEGDNMGYEIYRDHTYHNTQYQFTVPVKDHDGNTIMPTLTGWAEGAHSVTKTARRLHSTISVNGSTGKNLGGDFNGGWTNGILISNRKVIDWYKDHTWNKAMPTRNRTLAVYPDRSIREYPIDTDPQLLLKDGVVDAFSCYYPLVHDGQIIDFSKLDQSNPEVSPVPNTTDETSNGLCIGTKADNTWVLWANENRHISERGMTSTQMAQKMIDLGCVNAWQLDGGGSLSMNYCGYKLNRNWDDNGWTDRNLGAIISFIKPTASTNTASVAISKAAQFAFEGHRRFAYDLNTYLFSYEAWLGRFDINEAEDLTNALNEISTRINDGNVFPNGGVLKGTMIFDCDDNPIDQALGTKMHYIPCMWEFTQTGWTHRLGALKLTAINDPRIQLFKQFAKGNNPEWSDWTFTYNGVTTHNVKIIDPAVTKQVKVLQNGNVVEVDATIDAVSSSWTQAISGLPQPATRLQPFAAWGTNKVKAAFCNIDKSTFIIRTDTPDTYQVHFTYLTNDSLQLIY